MSAAPCSPSSVPPRPARPRPPSNWRRDSAPRSVRSIRCWSTGGWTSARPSHRRPIAAPCRTISWTSRSRRSGSRWPGTRSSPGARSPTSTSGARAPLLVGRVRPVSPSGGGPARVPGRGPRGPRASSSAEAEAAGCRASVRAARGPRPGCGGEDRARQRPPDRAGARGAGGHRDGRSAGSPRRGTLRPRADAGGRDRGSPAGPGGQDRRPRLGDVRARAGSRRSAGSWIVGSGGWLTSTPGDRLR